MEEIIINSSAAEKEKTGVKEGNATSFLSGEDVWEVKLIIFVRHDSVFTFESLFFFSLFWHRMGSFLKW